MIEKLKKFWFLITTIVVLLQTAVTFLFLYIRSESEVLNLIIIVLAGVYLFAFLILAFMSAHNKRYSADAMRRFKSSQKMVKRFLTLVMLVMNILFIINSKSGFIFVPIVMVVFNLFLLVLDFKLAEISENRARKKKKKLREKEMEKREAFDINKNAGDDGDYKKHKKKRFLGDFSTRKRG